MLAQDVDLENIINDSIEYKHPQEEEFPELKKNNLIYPPKHLQLRKLNSDIYDFSHRNIKEDIDKSEAEQYSRDYDDYNEISEPAKSIQSRRQKKKLINREFTVEQVGEFVTKKTTNNVFSMNNKENLNPFTCEPVDNTESVDLKLYKFIDFDIPYKPNLDVIEVISRKHPSMNTISCHTLSNLLTSIMDDKSMKRKNLMIIDCRFEYEYARGHIMGAKNMTSPNEIYREFFETQDKIVHHMRRDTIIVLHCEFSSHRGPQVYNLIRKTDRKINESKYPLISYPELYLLENGYKEFYENYPELCDPKGYISMDHEDFREERNKCMRRNKLLSENTLYFNKC